MSLQDSFYLVGAVGITFFVGIFAWAAYSFVLTLKDFRGVLADVKGTTDDLQMVKEGVKLGIITLFGRLVGSKGGGE